MKGLGRLDPNYEGLKKFHFEKFELDPKAVKKLFNPFKQKMDKMNAV